jgi:hypothetical protein
MPPQSRLILPARLWPARMRVSVCMRGSSAHRPEHPLDLAERARLVRAEAEAAVGYHHIERLRREGQLLHVSLDEAAVVDAPPCGPLARAPHLRSGTVFLARKGGGGSAERCAHLLGGDVQPDHPAWHPVTQPPSSHESRRITPAHQVPATRLPLPPPRSTSTNRDGTWGRHASTIYHAHLPRSPTFIEARKTSIPKPEPRSSTDSPPLSAAHGKGLLTPCMRSTSLPSASSSCSE